MTAVRTCRAMLVLAAVIAATGCAVYRHADPHNCDCLFGARVVGT